MDNAKDMLLADAIQTAIEAERKLIMYRWLNTILCGFVIVLSIIVLAG